MAEAEAPGGPVEGIIRGGKQPMRTHVRAGRGEGGQGPVAEADEAAGTHQLTLVEELDAAFDEDVEKITRVRCPDCTRPIALLADDVVLPEHAVCPTPWNPFGLTVCPGSGRRTEDATPADGPPADGPQEGSALLTLPAAGHGTAGPAVP